MRFKEIVSTQKIVDTATGIEYDGLVDTELIDLMNRMDNTIKAKTELLEKQLKVSDNLQKKLDLIDRYMDEKIRAGVNEYVNRER